MPHPTAGAGAAQLQEMSAGAPDCSSGFPGTTATSDGADHAVVSASFREDTASPVPVANQDPCSSVRPLPTQHHGGTADPAATRDEGAATVLLLRPLHPLKYCPQLPIRSAPKCVRCKSICRRQRPVKVQNLRLTACRLTLHQFPSRVPLVSHALFS